MCTRRILRYATSAAAPLVVLTSTAGQCNGSVDAPRAADAGEDQTVAVGELVTLDGSASSDSHGDPLTYAWELREATTP